MKKVLKIVLPIVLAIAILACTFWYLFVYDRTFTRDMLLNCARYSESQGSHNVAAWFYNLAYTQSHNSDAVAIELANQYKASGNYTKAEYTLYNAIADGAGVDAYVALSKIYVEQDKLLDAVNMLSSVTNETIKAKLETMRPAAPTATPDPGFYNQYISVSLSAQTGTIYYSHNGEYPSVNTAPYENAVTLADGENTIYAIAVNESGLVSPLSIFGFTVGGVIEEVQFVDASVETAIRSELGVSETTVLYTNDLWKITKFAVPEGAKNLDDLKHLLFVKELSIKNLNVSDITFISSLANIETLSITKTPISQESIAAISSLPLLKALTLADCGITSIAELKNAVNITTLDINNNAIRDISALSAMKNLQEANLEYNALTNLDALSGNTALAKLDISTNSITSLAPISTLTALTWLDASANSIEQLGQIDNLKSLIYLSLASNKLTDISGLNGCGAITELDLSSNALTSISGIADLKELMYFNFSHNQVVDLPKFSTDCALVTINGSHNKIKSLNNLSGLKSLNRVDMDYNSDISSVSSLAKCPMLIEVNVYGTGVTDVTALTNQCIVVNYDPVN